MPGFVRMHTLPKRFWQERNPTRSEYLSQQSYRRYLLTEDGNQTSRFAETMLPELGIVESFRFVRST